VKIIRDDKTGKRFGRLTVLAFSHMAIGRQQYWKCRCDCGNEIRRRIGDLKSGRTKSCGCLRKEAVGTSAYNFRHGMSNTRIYRIHRGMLARCGNSRSRVFKYYGGRGIKVCAGWHNATTFIKWALTNGYQNNLTLDRRENNGNYEPSNCRWVTMKVQRHNRREVANENRTK